MPPTSRRMPRRSVGGLALVLAGLTTIVGCGGSDNAAAPSQAPTVPAAQESFSRLQQQFVQVVRAVSPQVVQIESRLGLGSGVVFDGGGHIVTNAHVVAGSRRFVVTLSGGARHPATRVGADRTHDLAVI
jgi:S1-C subfamily serine protease